jgi:ABC-type Fe3+-hydroxamate transport system substrate-binding protein
VKPTAVGKKFKTPGFFREFFCLIVYFYGMILQRSAQLEQIPKRIISLVPSQTELLFHLGLEDETAGITKFCVHPQTWYEEKTRIGGTKAINIEKVKELHPDLVIANEEENIKEQVELLAADYPVWVTDVNNIADALKMIHDIGQLTGKLQIAKELVANIDAEFQKLRSIQAGSSKKLRTAYLIWKDPYMTVGGDTFIHSMMEAAGFENVFGSSKRYPEITIPQLEAAKCDIVFLSSEPYPFAQKHIDALREDIPGPEFILADGEMFSWYGSRMLLAPDYLLQLRSSVSGKITAD